MKYVIIVLFIIASFLYLYGSFNKNKRIKYISKPFLMPLLVIYYVLMTTKIEMLLVLGLLLGGLGDIFLINKEKKYYFILGLTSFLLGHIAYTYLFVSTLSFQLIPSYIYLVILIYILSVRLVYKELSNYLGEIKIAVIAYMVVIMAMSFTSLLRYWAISPVNFYFTFIGTTLFLVSDTLLAFYIFKKNIKNGDFYVGLTYVLAQVLITYGFII